MIHVTSVTSSRALIDQLLSFGNNFTFRGHADASWPLVSTLTRIARTSADPAFEAKAEAYSTYQLKSKLHLYRESGHVPEQDLEWLAMMQHYGIPTRLLDFTMSPFVALYFAAETFEPSSGADMAVFALNWKSAMDRAFAEIKKVVPTLSWDNSSMVLSGAQDKIFSEHVRGRSMPLLWVTEPARLNARIDLQNGCFVLSGHADKSIEDLLNGDLSDVDAHKLVVPARLYGEVCDLLETMNISAKTVYGDLDGLAKSIRSTLAFMAAAPKRKAPGSAP